MNFDSLSSVLLHIEYLVYSFPSKKASRSYSVDIFEAVSQVVQYWGKEAEVHLLRCLLSIVDFSVDSRGQPKDSCQAQFLNQLFVANAVVKPKPGFISSFCSAFDKPLRPVKLLEKASISQICRTLRFTPIQEVIFGLALAHSKQHETKKAATEFLRKTLPELLHSYSNLDTTKETGLQDCAVEAVHFILTSLCEDSEHFGVTSVLKEHFISTLRRDFPAEGVPAVLLPWLNTASDDYCQGEQSEDFAVDFTNTIEMASLSTISGSLALQIEEIGYGFTSSFETCKQQMLLLTAGSSATPSAVANVLAMMVRTHTGLEALTHFPQLVHKDGSNVETKWNVSIFARVLNEIAPDLNWSQVVVELDHPGFLVKDRAGLFLLTKGLTEGLRQNIFPIALLYKKWENTDGQLSWIVQILSYPDVFCFAEYPHRSVQTETLKAAPEDSNRDIATWKSLDLIDTLLHLSDAHGLYFAVRDLFDYPIKHCPDLLTLGLLQIPPPINPLRQELLTVLIPVFLGNHPNSSVVLNYAWNSPVHPPQSLRKVIISSMVEWYMKNQDDQSRLTKILDVARDLKDNTSNISALSALFSYPSYHFAVDLACLASRRDFLKLDKWLSDKILEVGEGPLASEIMQCLSACQQMLSSKQAAIGSVSVCSQPSSIFQPTSTGGLLTAQSSSNPPHPPAHAFGAPPHRTTAAMDIFGSGGSSINPLMSRLDSSHSFGGVGGLGMGSGFGDVLGSSSSGTPATTLRSGFGGTITPTPSGFGHISPAVSMMQTSFSSSVASVHAPRLSNAAPGWTSAGTVGFRPPTSAHSSLGPQGPPGSNLGSIAGAAGNLGGAVPSSSADRDHPYITCDTYSLGMFEGDVDHPPLPGMFERPKVSNLLYLF